MKTRPLNLIKTLSLSALLLTGMLFGQPATADPLPSIAKPDRPAISIIIDDLGNLRDRDLRAIRLPWAITYAFLPHTPHARELANLANSLNKEVMMHLPMEALERKRLGPGGLTLDMTRQQFLHQLRDDIAAVPHLAGINNHMGSLLTQHPGHMHWLMQELGEHDALYFVDSYTTKTSVAIQAANENWVPNIRRDVFLDSDRDPAKIRAELRRTVRLAREHGIALAIGHPYPETLEVLEQELPLLAAKGIDILPVSQLLDKHMQRFRTWRAFLSP
ncbi:MAG: divergent polysaccharide deacetylase family protein [Gammaproteobacteria bacterium]|nr:divergent polysaccharide deacetylase family protein [Gammaproteobacteria bacterium]MCF6362153.1 divergent polysaccharide deacetylase family protein [Gammaproteobacteria bacterium]